jgi:hypothetical protein
LDAKSIIWDILMYPIWTNPVRMFGNYVEFVTAGCTSIITLIIETIHFMSRLSTNQTLKKNGFRVTVSVTRY